MLFPIADALTVNMNHNVTAYTWLVRQLLYIVYLRNFLIDCEFLLLVGWLVCFMAYQPF